MQIHNSRLLKIAQQQLSLVGAAVSIIFVATKHIFCCNKTFAVTKRICVATKRLSQKIFVMTNIILSWQKFCHGKHSFVVTKDGFHYDKYLSWQKFCHNKHVFAAVNLNLSWQNFVVTSIFLSWQKTCFIATNPQLLWQTHNGHDKPFVATKIMLVAAPTNDNKWHNANPWQSLADNRPVTTASWLSVHATQLFVKAECH